MIDDFKKVPPRQPVRLDSDLPKTDQPKIERPAPSFRTPEQVASDGPMTTENGDVTDTKPAEAELLLPPSARPDKTAKSSTVKLFGRWTVSKKKLIIISVVLALLLVAGGTAFALTRSEPAPVKKPVVTKKKVVATPAPKPIVSPLTGLVVTAEQRDLPVIGVMIENSPNARPQSGLKEAGVVYEAIAEAGITRFLALYQENHAANVGPVRSARPYYLDWAMAFDAAYAHVGGSPDALQRIKEIGVKDMDQFFNPSAYHRITARFAPHNVYTSIGQLTDLAKSKGYDKSTFTSFPRKAEQPYKAPTPTPEPSPNAKTKTTAKPTATDTRTPANSIDFGISSAFYNAHYDYDAATNTYKRSEGGAAHMDAVTNTQLDPKVVIALAMPYGLMADGFHSAYTTIGSGTMFLFQDGTVTSGVWSKGEPKEQFVFKDDAGKILTLNPGQTWISVVGNPANVSYR